MIVGKRHVILAALVVALGVALYLNWSFSQEGKDLSISNIINGVENQDNSQKNYGDIKFVDNPQTTPDQQQTVKQTSELLEEARLNRKQARDQAVETINQIITKADISNEEKAMATEQANQLAVIVQKEATMESLIKAKNFEDCMVFLDKDKVNVIVKTPGLLSDEAAKIKDIILSEVEVLNENIRIVEVE